MAVGGAVLDSVGAVCAATGDAMKRIKQFCWSEVEPVWMKGEHCIIQWKDLTRLRSEAKTMRSALVAIAETGRKPYASGAGRLATIDRLTAETLQKVKP